MATLFGLLGNLSCVCAAVFVVIALFRSMGRNNRGRMKQGNFVPWRPRSSTQATQFRGDYATVPRLSTVTEQAFFVTLRDALPAGYTIMVQVALNRVVTVRHLVKTRHSTDKRWNHIAQKSLDFVVVRDVDMAPVLVIELDYHTHQRDDRRSRDQLVDAILADAQLPIIHQRVQPTYDRLALHLGYL
jgi:hypothetical protein